MTPPLCRFCRTPLIHTFVDLGRQPLANSYLTAEQLAAGDEPTYPLHARVCHQCFLVQVDDVVPADAIFDDGYAYFSAYSSSWVEHARVYAQAMAERFGLGSGSLVVEVASNDGYLLQHFVEMDVPVLGVEPTANTAAAAIARGVPTEISFFSVATGRDLAQRGLKADLMAANNVLAHVPDINDFVSGFARLLKQDGVATFEFPHVLNMMAENQFDTAYHEHFSYLSFHTVQAIFQAAGLELFDVEELSTHGGSLRIYAKHQEDDSKPINENVAALLQKEKEKGMLEMRYYTNFQQKAFGIKQQLLQFLLDQKKAGKKVAAYGAAAKGNTLLNYCGIKNDFIDFVVDANPHKQNKFLPASHIPVVNEAHLKETKPDYVLILPWNLREEITRQLAYIKDWDGKFVTAIPSLQVI